MNGKQMCQPSFKRPETFHETARNNAETAIKRIENFTKSRQLLESDHVLLEIRLDLLEENYKKFLNYNDLLDKEEEMENIYIETKKQLLYRLEFLCPFDNDNSDKNYVNKINNQNQENNNNPELSRPLNEVFEGYKSNFKNFIKAFLTKISENTHWTENQKIQYLKSNLTGTPLEIVNDNSTSKFTELIQILNRRYAGKQSDDAMSYKPVYTAFLNTDEITEELYDSIVDGAYDHAVEVSANLVKNNKGAIISDVTKRLAQENNRNLLSYVYKLWNGSEKNIVQQFMPETFSCVVSQENVILLHKKFGLALKLAAYTDNADDREGWGDSKDKTSKRVIWKLIPIWENNRVFFRLRNVDCNMNLKLELFQDDIGDRGAFGASHHDEDHARHTWYLEPVVINGEFLFFIVNCQFGQGLKLAEAADDIKDRRLWGHNGDIHGNPVRFGWYIKKHSSVNQEL